MKKILCFVLILTGLQLPARHVYLELQKALDKKLVEARASSGNTSARLSLKNNSKDSLVILVEAGRLLTSAVCKDQDLLVVKEEQLALGARQEKSVDLKVYSCREEMSCQPVTPYLADKMAGDDLLKLARFLNTRSFDREAEQAAVWTISDHYPVAGIGSASDSSLLALREYVAMLKKEELPWYSLSFQSYLRAGVTIKVPVALHGALSYYNDQEAYVTLWVRNSEGRIVGEVKSEWLKANGHGIYQLELPVKGFSRGRYTVELRTAQAQLALRQFEL